MRGNRPGNGFSLDNRNLNCKVYAGDVKASPAYYFVLFHPLRRQRHFPGVVVGVQQLVCHAG